MIPNLRKWHIGLIAIFGIIFASFITIFSLKATPVEINTEENWNLDIVYYDSSVNAGKTPLTKIDWDASDNACGYGEPRVITVQINYDNDTVTKDYGPEELCIELSNLSYLTQTDNKFVSDVQWEVETKIGANYDNNTGFKWNFVQEQDNLTKQSTFKFYNAEEIKAEENFEGSIQIVYTITPSHEGPVKTAWGTSSGYIIVEKYEDSCVHNYSTTTIAKLFINNTLKKESNILELNYTRTYYHPWLKQAPTIKKTASKLSSMDKIPAGDYFWVKYTFSMENIISYIEDTTVTRYLPFSSYILDEFPEDCLVLDSKLNLLTLENNIYKGIGFDDSENSSILIYVGYPKSIYNENAGTLEITNHVDLYIKHATDEDYSKIDEDDVSLNLANFEFTYSGNLYYVSKQLEYDAAALSKKYMIDPDFEHFCDDCHSYAADHITTGRQWILDAKAIYSGKKMTVRIGDDLLYITDKNGNYRQLTDDEYYIKSIELPYFINGNQVYLNSNEYEMYVYVRYANELEYEKYQKAYNSTGIYNGIDFSKLSKKVVAFYVEFKNLEESVIVKQDYYNEFDVNIIYNPTENIADNGQIFNFSYISVTDEDENILNNVTLDNYANIITKEEIATYDINTYGHYMQRGYASTTYTEMPDIYCGQSTLFYKYMEKFSQDNENEIFMNKNRIQISISGPHRNPEIENYNNKVYKENIELFDSKLLDSMNTYDLLPRGMDIKETPEELLETISTSITDEYFKKYHFVDKNGNNPFNNKEELVEYFKKYSIIKITKNWNNTGRTKIDWIVDFNENEILFLRSSSFNIILNYTGIVNYENYFEYGSVYTNQLCSYYVKNQERYHSIPEVTDNGELDRDMVDINEDGDITDTFAYTKDSETIVSTISTHQDVAKFVKTDMNYFQKGISHSPLSSEYEYKLRVRAGNNKITNLIIYDNIENAVTDKATWQGEFLGIDTYDAEQKGYAVKTYYSENPNAGNLTDDTSWKEYQETDIYKETVVTSPNWPNNYPSSMWENENYWEFSEEGASKIYITFDKASELYSYASYLNIYDKEGNRLYRFQYKDMTGKTFVIDGDYVKLTMSAAYGSSKGFSAEIHSDKSEILIPATDNSKVKSIAFEILDSEGNPAIINANTSISVNLKFRSPSEDLTTLAHNNCRTQWNAIDEYGQTVDFITGIKSNTVRVALPSSVLTDWIKGLTLNFIKTLQGDQTAFEKMQLNQEDNYIFQISLINQLDNSVINGIVEGKYNNEEISLTIKELPIGTYLIKELPDNYFSLLKMEELLEIEGITFEKTNEGYLLTIAELTDEIAYDIKITNEIDSEKYYEDKEQKENLIQQ